MVDATTVSRECAQFKTRKASRVMTRIYERFCGDSGLKATQFSLLTAADIAGAISIGDLADAMVMDRTTLSRNLRPLLKQGLLELAAGGDDRRVRRVKITPAGRARLRATLRSWQDAQRYVRKEIGEDRWFALQDVLSSLAELDVPE